MGPNLLAMLMGVMHPIQPNTLGATFANVSQCYHGADQAQMPMYSGTWLKGSRSHGNQCVGLEQPFGPVSLQ
jgi:hypothetical protein